MLLTKEMLLGIKDTKIETVTVKEWDCDVNLKKLSGGERDIYESWIYKKSNGKTLTDSKDIKAKLIAMCLVDADGNKLLDADKREDLDMLNAKSASALNFIFEKCSEINGMGNDGVDEAKKS